MDARSTSITMCMISQVALNVMLWPMLELYIIAIKANFIFGGKRKKCIGIAYRHIAMRE